MATETNTINQNETVIIENDIAERAQKTAIQQAEHKSKILEWLKKLVDIFRKHGVYSAMEEMKDCIGEMTYANAETAEILSQIITIMDNTEGRLQGVDVPSAESQKIIDDLQSNIKEKTESLKAAILKDKSIDEVLNGFVQENKPYGLFGDGKNIYVADIVDGKAGDKIYNVQRIERGEGERFIVLSEVKVDETVRAELSLKVSNNNKYNDEAYKTLIKNTLVENAMSETERTGIEQLKAQLRQATSDSLSDKRFEMDSERFKTKIKDNRFFVGDRYDGVVYVFSNNENKEIEATVYKCNNKLQPVGKPLSQMPVAKWVQNSNGTVSSVYNKPEKLDTDTIWKLNTVQSYLSASGISKVFGEQTSPNQINEKLTDKGRQFMGDCLIAMKEAPVYNDLIKKGYSIKKENGKANGFLLSNTNNNLIVKINVDGDGRARNIEYDVTDDNKGFVKSHVILNNTMLSQVKEAPLDVQMFGKLYMKASENVLNRNEYIKDDRYDNKAYDKDENDLLYVPNNVVEEKTVSPAGKEYQNDIVIDKNLETQIAAAQQEKVDDLDTLGKTPLQQTTSDSLSAESLEAFNRETVVKETLSVADDFSYEMLYKYIADKLSENEITVDELYEKNSEAKIKVFEDYTRDMRENILERFVIDSPDFKEFIEKNGVSMTELTNADNKATIMKLQTAIVFDSTLTVDKRGEYNKLVDEIRFFDRNALELAKTKVNEFDTRLEETEKRLKEKAETIANSKEHNEKKKGTVERE